MSILYYTLNNSVFTNFAFYSTASVVKMMGLSALTVFKRMSKDVKHKTNWIWPNFIILTFSFRSMLILKTFHLQKINQLSSY